MTRAVAFLAAALAAAVAHAQGYLGLAPTQNAGAFRAQAGQSLSFVCPATDGSKAKLYGTDTYTDDSAVCAAAIHAGVLKAGRAGVVTIQIGNGAKTFKGSDRNGIASHDYGSWGHSYSFVRDGVPGNITWATVWNGIPEDFTDPIVVNCPPEGNASKTIWGTDVYTRDSTICVAAAHTGSITPEKGGLITVRRAPAPKEYTATERFRITSQRWGSSADAFSVTVAQHGNAATAATAATVTATTSARRRCAATIALASTHGRRLGQASLARIAPRTIALAAFTGVGSAPSSAPIGPRTSSCRDGPASVRHLEERFMKAQFIHAALMAWLAVSVAAPAVAQQATADVTFNLPLNLTGLPAQITEVKLRCQIDSSAFGPSQGVERFATGRRHAELDHSRVTGRGRADRTGS